jgi:AcrR family transcriptional regulator
MSALIDKERRRRAKEQRVAYQEQLLKAARYCFVSLPFADVSLDVISHRAKVPQGKADLYFRSKEELLLQVARQEVDEWVGALEQGLSDAGYELERDRVVEILTASLAPRWQLLRLLERVNVVLESNIDAETGHLFLHHLNGRFDSLGHRLEESCPWIERGHGSELLHRLRRLASSLHLEAHPDGFFAMALFESDSSGMGVDFRRELEWLVAVSVDAASANRFSD